MKCWMRILSVRLTSTKFKKTLIFGENYRKNEDDFYITVNGNKYMSALKDEFVVRISNLTYSEIVQIVDGQFYDIEIQAGYRSTGPKTIFKGGVIYISNEKTDMTTNTVILLCGSQLVAKYGQTRINLTLNSGVNMYAAITYAAKKAKLPTSNVSNRMLLQILQNPETINESFISWVEKLGIQNETYATNSDSILNSVFSIYDMSNDNYRTLQLNKNSVLLVNGYPKLTNDGVTFTMLPTLSLICGDTIKIDNDLIDVSASSRFEANKNYGMFLDVNGMYKVYQMRYSLSNRDNNFNCQVICKSNALMSKLLVTK